MRLEKFLLLILFFSFFFIFLTYFFIFDFLKSKFLSIEKNKSIQITQGLENYFKKELENLYNLTKDWAAWDDAYFFMQNRNPNFIKSNITKETYLNLKIDLLLYTDLKGNPVAGGLFNTKNFQIYTNNALKNLINSLLPLASKKKTEGIAKLIFFQDKPFMVVMHPVLKSNDTGPKDGYLLMGKFITIEEINWIKKLFSINNLKILPAKKNYPKIKILKADLNGIVLEKYRFLNENYIKLYIFYPIEKNVIKIILFRIIFVQLFILAIFGLLLFFIFNHYIIKALKKLIKEIDEIKKKKKSFLSSEYAIQEFKDLTKAINEYIQNIFLKEKICATIAEKTENLILLFDTKKDIFFRNKNIAKYFTPKELNSFIEDLIKWVKEDQAVRKEIQIKTSWFKIQIIPFSKDLYLLVGWDITKTKAKEEEFFRLATRDFLTGLYNRRYFEDILERVYFASQRGEKFILLFIDCDDLKKINDTFGHLIGDEALKNVAKAIKAGIRKEDIACRWGGDEFVVILNHCKKEEGLKIAKRIIEDLQKMPIQINSKIVKINVSIGMVEIDGSKDIHEILNLADKLAYSAKREKKEKIKY